jgi:hypothetical protein
MPGSTKAGFEADTVRAKRCKGDAMGSLQQALVPEMDDWRLLHNQVRPAIRRWIVPLHVVQVGGVAAKSEMAVCWRLGVSVPAQEVARPLPEHFGGLVRGQAAKHVRLTVQRRGRRHPRHGKQQQRDRQPDADGSGFAGSRYHFGRRRFARGQRRGQRVASWQRCRHR